MFDVSDSSFQKSSVCEPHPNFCVAVARTPQGVAVRDTKDEKKTTLFFSHDEWDAFTKGVKNGEFDV